MPIGLPVKANYAAGDILTAVNMNDLSGTFNNVATSYGNAAGKNKIINGDFGIWQRGTTFSYTGSGATTYTADRFAVFVNGNGTYTISQQAFTAGTAPVSGYESQFFCRFATNTVGTSTQGIIFDQRIENVRTLAGQAVTISFWAKADSARNITPFIAQNFGSGGSSAVQTNLGSTAITTSWVRYSFTTTLASITGKTIGTGNYLNFYISTGIAASQTIDIWGLQVEAGSIATPFATASGGSIQGELAMCQRYYYLHTSGTSQSIGSGFYRAANDVATFVKFPVTMRTAPTSAIVSGTNYYAMEVGGVVDGVNSFTLLRASTNGSLLINNSEASGVVGQSGEIFNNNALSFLAFTAEL
jgi:hypothetical protein